ncbi:MAG: hypothetical protein CHACPFDD_01442 [Phycisphaerae bacterium]|nr:hypothetical protein [Phycisphaerae bacterium]
MPGGSACGSLGTVEKLDARKTYLDYLARCDQAFRPYVPIDLPEFFAGRVAHVRRLEEEINAPGRHVAIFGERGVGKTSLARLAYFFVKRDEERTHFVRCSKASTFDTVFAEVLASAGVEVVLSGVESEGEQEGRLGIGSIGAAVIRRSTRTYRRIDAGPEITPKLLIDQMGNRNDLIIIDEYDRVEDTATHTRLAELIKHFSDAGATCKFLLVGVAETLTELIGKHESLSRSLAQIKLDRMSDEELLQIIEKAEAHLRVSFKGEIARRLIRLADGFPYFVHLIGRHAARTAGEELLKNPKANLVVAEQEYAAGLHLAIENAEHSLPDQYQRAIITTRRPSEKFTLILWAMALSDEREVQVKDVAQSIGFFTGEAPKPGGFNWNLGELVSEKRGNVLTKVREGWYKFANPLMRPYVRSLMERENIHYRGMQWEFPFMKSPRAGATD